MKLTKLRLNKAISSITRPLIKASNFDDVLKFFNEVESEFDWWYDMCDRRGHLRLDAPRNCHTYICNECIEKALGHPIYREDINSSPFNLSYIKSHFGPDGDSNITEDYFDNVDLKLDIGEFTGNEESEFPVCDMPTHKFFFEINTTLYKLFGLKKTYDMMKRCIKKLMIYLDASRMFIHMETSSLYHHHME